MADYCRDFVYSTPFLPVVSLDGLPTKEQAGALQRIDQDDPETLLIQGQDVSILHRWVRKLPPKLREVVDGLLDGESQAAIARRLGVSEPAISKRMKRVAALAIHELGAMRRSPLFC